MNDIQIKARNIIYPPDTKPDVTVNVDILAGYIYGFIGPDSTVISTWLQTLAAVTPATSGQIEFMGQRTDRLDRNAWQNLRTKLAFLDYRSTLLSVLSTQENILLPALYHQLGSREALLENMYKLLENIGFADISNLSRLPAYIDEVSYCQAMLVRTVLARPNVIVLDNTLRHFDERISRQMLIFLKDYLEKSQACLLLHDDDAEFVQKHANKIIYIDKKYLLQFNSQSDLQASGNDNVLQYIHELAVH